MTNKKPLSIAIGTLAAVSFSLATYADDTVNPFEMKASDGSTVIGEEPEGSCGEDKDKDEGSCGEGSCGEDKDEGSCGEDKDEGSCGEDHDEGSCGEDHDEGSCGEDK